MGLTKSVGLTTREPALPTKHVNIASHRKVLLICDDCKLGEILRSEIIKNATSTSCRLVPSNNIGLSDPASADGSFGVRKAGEPHPVVRC